MNFIIILIFLLTVSVYSKAWCDKASGKSCGKEDGRGKCNCELFKWPECQCICETHYSGDECEDYSCFGVDRTSKGVCSGHGTCSAYNKCGCETGYAGDDCNEWTCNGINSTSTDVCMKHGQCVDFNTCQCNVTGGWTGTYCDDYCCKGIPHEKTTSVCDGHGECTGPNNCSCQENYSGIDCSKYKCFNKWMDEKSVCHAHGTCILPDNCTCHEGYFGSECDDYTCWGDHPPKSRKICHDHGNCSGENICSCDEGWLGRKCEDWGCENVVHSNPSVCSSHGKCELDEVKNTTECVCQNGYFDSNCSNWNCDGISWKDTTRVCSSHGKCVKPNTCICDHQQQQEEGEGDNKKNYDGKYCSLWTCFGMQNNDTKKVCSGHGNCTDVDICTCEKGYSREKDCSDWSCEGIDHKTVGVVCSGHGDCVAYDECVCDQGHWDPISYCKNWTCNGTDYWSEKVCSGHGSCLLNSFTCNCVSGYWADFCEDWDCFRIRRGDADVCSGHGTCVDADHCECGKGYDGDECSQFTCFGVVYAEYDTVCSGHGKCVSFDTCVCEKGYKGSKCDLSTSDNNSKRLSTMLRTVFLGIVVPVVVVVVCIVISFCCCILFLVNILVFGFLSFRRGIMGFSINDDTDERQQSSEQQTSNRGRKVSYGSTPFGRKKKKLGRDHDHDINIHDIYI